MSKLSIKMFIKRETGTGKIYAYRILLSFKMSVTLIFFFTLRRTTAPFVKPFSLDIIQFFVRHCPMSGANIQA